jgi:hypothetical protein
MFPSWMKRSNARIATRWFIPVGRIIESTGLDVTLGYNYKARNGGSMSDPIKYEFKTIEDLHVVPLEKIPALCRDGVNYRERPYGINHKIGPMFRNKAEEPRIGYCDLHMNEKKTRQSRTMKSKTAGKIMADLADAIKMAQAGQTKEATTKIEKSCPQIDSMDTRRELARSIDYIERGQIRDASARINRAIRELSKIGETNVEFE